MVWWERRGLRAFACDQGAAVATVVEGRGRGPAVLVDFEEGDHFLLWVEPHETALRETLEEAMAYVRKGPRGAFLTDRYEEPSSGALRWYA